MPRQARLDVPGALQHVMVRGVAGCRIFLDTRDHEEFLDRFGKALKESGARCQAWVLMPNHAHFLIRTGKKSLGKMMQGLLLWYALKFNRRHRRSGHLFQNRYKSIICEEEPYFLELVRYIHLNPLRAGIVGDLGELARYRWCGHGAVLGRREVEWQDIEGVLESFGGTRRRGRQGYQEYVAEGRGMGRRPDLTGGGLIRSLGGIEGVLSARRQKRAEMGDERILGSGEYVAEIIREAEGRDRRSAWLGERLTPRQVMAKAAKECGLGTGELVGKSKRPAVVRARALACKWLVEDMGLPGVEVAGMLGVTPAAVSKSTVKGRDVEEKLKVSLGGPGER